MQRLTLFAALLGLVSACSETPPPNIPTEAPRKARKVRTQRTDLASDDGTRGSIAISEEIARACDIPSAFFPFDSSEITGDAANALEAVAECFTKGPMKKRNLNIVGHADPRGSTDYNLALGQRRAGSVALYLVVKGVADDRINTSSLGEMEATGMDESSWARDRRVEISLADKNQL